MTGEQMAAFMKITQSAAVRGHIAEDTPEGWEFIIGQLPYTDCVEALRRFVTRPNPEGKRGPWINAMDIYEEVRKVRADRASRTDASFLDSAFYPQEIEGESEQSYARRTIEAKRAYVKAIADGEPEPQPKQIPARYDDPKHIMGGVFKSPNPAPKTLLTPGVQVELSPLAKARLRARLERAA